MNVLLWHKDMPPGLCGITALGYCGCLCFLKHRGLAVHVILILRARRKICTYLRVAQKLSLILLLVLFWRTTNVFNDAAWISLSFPLFKPKKLEIIFIPPLYLRCHPCISTESFVLHVKSFTARRQCCCMCHAQIRLMGGRGSAELTIKGSAVIHSPITGRSTPSLRTHMTTMAHFSSLSDRYV